MALNSYRKNLKVLDGEIGDNPFVAGDNPTVADCTLYSTLDFGDYVGQPLDPAFANITRWRADFSKRPSASA